MFLNRRLRHPNPTRPGRSRFRPGVQLLEDRSVPATITVTILRTLARGAKSITGLAEACQMPQSRVSHHVATLEHTGLIAVEQDGRFRRCALVGAVTAAGIELAHPSGVKVVLPLG